MTLPGITTETVTTLTDALPGIWCGDLSRTALDRAISPCSAHTHHFYLPFSCLIPRKTKLVLIYILLIPTLLHECAERWASITKAGGSFYSAVIINYKILFSAYECSHFKHLETMEYKHTYCDILCLSGKNFRLRECSSSMVAVTPRTGVLNDSIHEKGTIRCALGRDIKICCTFPLFTEQPPGEFVRFLPKFRSFQELFDELRCVWRVSVVSSLCLSYEHTWALKWNARGHK